MENQKLSVALCMDGSVLTMPARLTLGYQKGHLLAHGRVQASQMNPEAVIREISKEAAEQFQEPLKTLVDNVLPEELIFHYENEQSMLWVHNDNSNLGIVWTSQGLACLMAIRRNEGAQAGTLEYYLSEAAKLFGIEQIFLYGKKGSVSSPPLLTNAVLGEAEEFHYPSAMNQCSFLFCGKFSFDKDKDLVGWFLHEAFGIEQTRLSLFMGMGQGEFMAYAMLPVFEGKVLSAEELYLGMEFGKRTGMVLAGTFRFSFIKDALFQVNSSIGTDEFELGAFARLDKPINLFGNFSIGDTSLSIGVGKSGMAFRLFSNLYIGEIKVFGAVGVAVAASPELEFLSTAITDITLSKLIKNIFGKDIPFADGLDFLELTGLPLGTAADVAIQIGKEEDVKSESVKARIVSRFNELVSSNSFTVTEENVAIERITGTTDEDVVVLTDKSRMRHYSISSKGKLGLQAQFYYSRVDTRLGDYTLKKGIFLCGSITLFQKFTVKALFSMSESDGVLAYASIDSIDLGILRIGPSGIDPGDNPLSHFSQDSLLWLLMDDKPAVQGSYTPKGAVFFLRANKQECQFYIDGKIELFRIFSVAVRALYANKTISIDAQFNISSLIKTTLQIKAAYGDMSNANFSVQLIIDCTGLEKALKNAKKSIDQAIENLKKKINGAKEKLTQAQNHVNELHSQIDNFDRKISDCKSAIRNAKWYKKAFVAIAKGAEIAAYEVAKGALYTAIGVANAALEVAKLAVSAAGAVGEGVLKIISGAIDATLNLFFIKYIRLCAAASTSNASFEAEIEFVALGKTFSFKKTLGAQGFFNQPDSMLDDSISDNLKPELDNIENGSFKSNRRRYKKMQCSIRECQKMLGQGMDQLQAGTSLLQGMSEKYLEHCNEMLPEYEHFSYSYANALGEVESVLALANDTVSFDQMDEAVGMIKNTMQDGTSNIPETKRQALESAVNEYEAASKLVGKMGENAVQIREQKENMLTHLEEMKAEEKEALAKTGRTVSISQESMENVLNDTEELMYENFPPTKGRGTYINLSRESKIKNSLDEMRKNMGLSASASVERTRSKRTPLEYEERL